MYRARFDSDVSTNKVLPAVLLKLMSSYICLLMLFKDVLAVMGPSGAGVSLPLDGLLVWIRFCNTVNAHPSRFFLLYLENNPYQRSDFGCILWKANWQCVTQWGQTNRLAVQKPLLCDETAWQALALPHLQGNSSVCCRALWCRSQARYTRSSTGDYSENGIGCMRRDTVCSFEWRPDASSVDWNCSTQAGKYFCGRICWMHEVS